MKVSMMRPIKLSIEAVSEETIEGALSYLGCVNGKAINPSGRPLFGNSVRSGANRILFCFFYSPKKLTLTVYYIAF
jgi:hypothetical protein